MGLPCVRDFRWLGKLAHELVLSIAKTPSVANDVAVTSVARER